jgi:hypothetical protein
MWFQHGKQHRDDGAAVEWADGAKEWYLHGKRHSEQAPAIEYADGRKFWYLHGNHYDDANAWAQAVLKLHHKPHDADAIERFLRDVLMKDDLI